MRLKLYILVIVGLFFSQLTTKAFTEDVPVECPVTAPSDGRFQPNTYIGPVSDYAHKRKTFLYGNDKLSVALPVNGTWKTLADYRERALPYEGNLRWFRVDPAFSQNDGPFTVTMRRLDIADNGYVSRNSSPNYRLKSSVPDDSGTMMKTFIKISSSGCWQVTGHYKDQKLSFVVWVHLVRADYHPFISQGAVDGPYR